MTGYIRSTRDPPLRWKDTPHLGRSGFVHSRLVTWGYLEYAEIQFHAPQYAVQFFPAAGPQCPPGFHYFDSLSEAKDWAIALVLLGD